mmetsp:Transcript_12799/g.22923  ORF Transcript_12799/g.22923 Transcript_12799/m.22923 type:complete len:88 (+) Transcript_12799:479-742(+)
MWRLSMTRFGSCLGSQEPTPKLRGSGKSSTSWCKNFAPPPTMNTEAQRCVQGQRLAFWKHCWPIGMNPKSLSDSYRNGLEKPLPWSS